MLKKWQFSRDSINWNAVTVPHDWAIYGPFDRENDLQVIAIEQNGETEESLKTGRTGGLPFIGKGYYKTTFTLPDNIDGRSMSLVFDGAMSHAKVYVNGRQVAYWPYGYNSFHCSLDGVAHAGENTLEVSLENKRNASRWYPGAGLYRNVRLVQTDTAHIPVWGTYITTPHVDETSADVKLRTKLAGVKKGESVTLRTTITAPDGKVVDTDTHTWKYYPDVEQIQNFVVANPQLWSPESPNLYTASTEVIKNDAVVDKYDTRFGIRTVEIRPDKGFLLNGKVRKFQGVCNHHDLGPLGAAVNKSALRHQLQLLKDMGADAVRTSHNMPAPELVALCDEMGLMMMVETFDDWGFRPKSINGYGSYFDQWAEKDVTNMVHQYRNNPSVVMWSIGNEVPSQWGEDGIAELTMLQDIIHAEDPTRPVTCGMDQLVTADNGFAAALDVPGFNYKPSHYPRLIEKMPQRVLLGSETASTVSSRGVYHFPVTKGASQRSDDKQSSSYDLDYCDWSNVPDDDFAKDDDMENVIGQFVWTGFDYLGEPTPYDTDAWPSHSSYFGIIDLASIPKDRYYLYRSKWNENDATLHVLPHWTWPERVGQVTPVFVYTSYPKAELFINGRSQGVREKNRTSNLHRYRLMWDETVYEPGEVKVVAYDADGNVADTKVVRTAGKPHHLVLTPNRTSLSANGEDLAYITVQMADKDGNILPRDSREVKFSVKGAGHFRATANGDATSLRDFNKPVMDLFSGAATVIVESGDRAGNLTLEVSAKGLPKQKLTIPVK